MTALDETARRELARELRALKVTPGDVIILRGPGWNPEDIEGVALEAKAHLRRDTLVVWLPTDTDDVGTLDEQELRAAGWSRTPVSPSADERIEMLQRIQDAGLPPAADLAAGTLWAIWASGMPGVEIDVDWDHVLLTLEHDLNDWSRLGTLDETTETDQPTSEASTNHHTARD